MDNNKKYHSVLYKEIENKIFSLSKDTKLISFWKVNKGNNAEELYNNYCNFINSNEFLEKLSNFSEVEAEIIKLIYDNDGITTRFQIVEAFKKEYQIKELQNAVLELLSVFFIYERKSLGNLSGSSFKYILYPEIKNVLDKYKFDSFDADKRKKIDVPYSKFENMMNLSEELKKLLYINNGLLTIEEIKKSDIDLYKVHIEELEKSKDIVKQLFIINKSIRLFYILNLNNMVKDIKLPITNNINMSKSKNNNYYDWINYLQSMFLYIKEHNINYTQKGNIKKTDYDNLIKICNESVVILEFLLQIMRALKLCEEDERSTKVNKNFRKFIKTDINSKYKILLQFHKSYQEIIDFMKAFELNDNFNIYELIKGISQYKQENDDIDFTLDLDEKIFYYEGILNELEILGLISKHKINDEYYYSFTEVFSRIYLKKYSKLSSINHDNKKHKESILLNRDFSIIIYPDKIDAYDRMLIFTFTEKVSHKEMITRRITKRSIQEAIFLGYNVNEFIETIKHTSIKPPDEQILSYCCEWAKSIKIVEMKKVYLIEGDEDIIKTIELDPDINIGNIKRIGDKHIIVNNPDMIPHILGIDNIFVYKEDEDF